MGIGFMSGYDDTEGKPIDGDTVFALSTGTGGPATLEQQVRLGVAAVEVLRTAIERSVLAGR